MSFQYNYNHFEPYTHYGCPSWMTPTPPGCLQDPVSCSQTTQDHPSPPQPSANEGGPVLVHVGSSRTAEAANIYTVVLKVLSLKISEIINSIHYVISILKLSLQQGSYKKR